MAPKLTLVQPRLLWRAVVKGDRKLGDGHVDAGLAWHLAPCTAPGATEAHCARGQQLMADVGDPDGHCLNGDVCPRCDETAVEPAEAVVESPVIEPVLIGQATD